MAWLSKVHFGGGGGIHKRRVTLACSLSIPLHQTLVNAVTQKAND